MANSKELPYRDCVGICVLNKHNQVWLGKRVSAAELEGSQHTWQMPQGGIDKGEEALPAALRELFEETSMKSVTLLEEASDWFYYDFPDDIVRAGKIGKFKGQRQRWFAFRFEGDDSEIEVIEPGGGKHPQEFEDWRWGDLESTPDLIVPFKKGVYEKVVAAFRHLVD